MDDQELVHRLQNGDQEAVAALVDQYSTKIFRGAYLILKDFHRAEDIVQETFTSAVIHIHQFKGNSTLYSWLYRIALNHCRGLQRKKSWNFLSFFPGKELEGLGPRKTEDEGPLEEILAKEQQRGVTDLVWSLPYLYRVPITLYYYEQFSIEEISTILNKSPGTIKSLLSRGRQKLRINLSEGGN